MANSTNTKVYLFDLGNVLFPLNFERVRETLIELGVADQKASFEFLIKLPCSDQFEAGEISREIYFSELQKILGIDASLEQIQTVYNSLLDRIDLNTLSVIRKLQKNFRVACLSNTNEVHIEHLTELLNMNGISSFSELFSPALFSHSLKKRKPAKECYQEVISLLGVEPDEITFFDDSLVNVEAAKQCGINAVLFDCRKGKLTEQVQY